ncbi:RagB/SusD family nutrient uptake outer membrane protein [Rufibacter sediminis]|uniref:RagB/SusD family nutrient uptake outer membrane protein n=1 Tax=Rufibacter sediminis TaxID=2762756 RepID=A0ABR6VUD5_9BACT|nr:RagB/SusD family nutrient uptake outer membrane protein [Rufibacter sediminis]MBC3540764.1 RagB/SusD family nutrient uptake outer membrane protein [Rufibacter sediminis]
MKLNKIAIYTLAGALLMGAPACDEFLELEPISEATTENAYKSATDAEAALVGVYESFQAEYYIWDNLVFSEILSDNYYAGGDNAEIFAVDNIAITPTNSRLWNNWSQIYNAIAKANVVLQKVPLITDPQLSETRKAQILGEASFLRAYHYFQLVKLWGGVPLVLEPVTSLDPAVTQKPRATEIEVYNQIVADLTFALDNRLPDTYGGEANVNKARATRGAANALLAKAWAQRPDRDYTKVLQYADAVINSPAGYELLPNFNHLFDGTHYNNAESIMEIQFIGGNEANWGPQMLLPPSLSGDTWRKFMTPSRNLVNAYDSEGDNVRKNTTILFENAPWSDEFWSVSTGGSVPFAYRWKSANGWASTNRQYIFRLGDIMLLKAEALNELNRLEEARTVLNTVRRRVNLGPNTSANKEEMRMAILKERRLELAQEGHRWDDLRRYGVAVETMNNLNEIDLRTNTKKDYNVATHELFLPIPQSEINRNPQLVQTPGYN